MTTNRTPWGREIAEARTDQRDPRTMTPWGRTVQLTEDQKRERNAREMREAWAKQAEAKRKADEEKRKAEETKPTGGKVTIRTDNPGRVRAQIREMREALDGVS